MIIPHIKLIRESSEHWTTINSKTYDSLPLKLLMLCERGVDVEYGPWVSEYYLQNDSTIEKNIITRRILDSFDETNAHYSVIVEHIGVETRMDGYFYDDIATSREVLFTIIIDGLEKKHSIDEVNDLVAAYTKFVKL